MRTGTRDLWRAYTLTPTEWVGERPGFKGADEPAYMWHYLIGDCFARGYEAPAVEAEPGRRWPYLLALLALVGVWLVGAWAVAGWLVGLAIRLLGG